VKFVKSIAVILNFLLLWWVSGRAWHEITFGKSFWRWTEEELLLSILIICLSANLIILAKDLMSDNRTGKKKDSIFSLWFKVKRKKLEDELEK